MLVAVVALAALSQGCGRTIARAAERRVRDMATRVIGPARAWRAHVDGTQTELVGGRVRSIALEGDDVDLCGIVHCRRLKIQAGALSMADLRRGAMGPSVVASFSAGIDEASLNRYLRDMPRIPGSATRVSRVLLGQGLLRMFGTRSVLGRPFRFALVARPRLKSAVRLEFAARSLAVGGHHIPAPPGVLEFLARFTDSHFDFGTLPVPLRVGRFAVTPQEIAIEGTVDLREALSGALVERSAWRAGSTTGANYIPSSRRRFSHASGWTARNASTTSGSN